MVGTLSTVLNCGLKEVGKKEDRKRLSASIYTSEHTETCI
jgi:hypothetical protein